MAWPEDPKYSEEDLKATEKFYTVPDDFEGGAGEYIGTGLKIGDRDVYAVANDIKLLVAACGPDKRSSQMAKIALVSMTGDFIQRFKLDGVSSVTVDMSGDPSFVRFEFTVENEETQIALVSELRSVFGELDVKSQDREGSINVVCTVPREAVLQAMFHAQFEAIDTRSKKEVLEDATDFLQSVIGDAFGSEGYEFFRGDLVGDGKKIVYLEYTLSKRAGADARNNYPRLQELLGRIFPVERFGNVSPTGIKMNTAFYITFPLELIERLRRED